MPLTWMVDVPWGVDGYEVKGRGQQTCKANVNPLNPKGLKTGHKRSHIHV